jgi:hypothetical protein
MLTPSSDKLGQPLISNLHIYYALVVYIRFYRVVVMVVNLWKKSFWGGLQCAICWGGGNKMYKTQIGEKR